MSAPRVQLLNEPEGRLLAKQCPAAPEGSLVCPLSFETTIDGQFDCGRPDGHVGRCIAYGPDGEAVASWWSCSCGPRQYPAVERVSRLIGDVVAVRALLRRGERDHSARMVLAGIAERLGVLRSMLGGEGPEDSRPVYPRCANGHVGRCGCGADEVEL